jgi:hypothetical protein
VSSVPQSRIAALNASHNLNLGLEEETMRIRHGEQTGVLDKVLLSGKRNLSIVVGSRRPWMKCWVCRLEMDVVWGNSDGGDSGNGDSGGGGHAFGSKGNNGIPIVLNCLLHCLICREQECSDVRRRSNGDVRQWRWRRILPPPILQPIGVLANHCVKKDEPYYTASTSSGGIVIAGNTIAAMQATTKLAPNLDISSFSGNKSNRSGISVSSAPRAVPTIGRFLLCYLFYQSLLSLLRFSSLLLFLSFLVSSHGGGDHNTVLCCSILQMSFNKFTGMAPTAMEHTTLLL